MRILIACLVMGIGVAGMWGWMAVAQPVAGPNPRQSTAALVEELVAQQKQLSENLTQIETRVATIEEDVRQARIFARRGGGGRN